MEKKKQNNPASIQGFALIELSIVLVIVGLLVGGILVGRDLIRAAEISADISQVGKFNAAVNTFRIKYGGLPGDLQCQQAQALGFFSTVPCGTTGLGDGNGLLQDTTGFSLPYGENLIFWRHLSESGLIDGSYGIVGNSAIAATGYVTADVTVVSQSLPPAKSGRGGYWIAYASSAIPCGGGGVCDRQPAGTNSYALYSIVKVLASGGFYTISGFPLTPIEAYNIDTKLDDGLPNTGIVEVRLPIPDLNPASSAVATKGVCMIGDSAIGALNDPLDTYNRDSNNGGNVPACGIRIRFN